MIVANESGAGPKRGKAGTKATVAWKVGRAGAGGGRGGFPLPRPRAWFSNSIQNTEVRNVGSGYCKMTFLDH